MRSLVADFANSVTGVQPSTLAVYERDLVAFSEWSATVVGDEVASVDRRTVRRYLAHLDGSGYARRTIARKMSSLRRFFDWARLAGHITNDPTVGISSPPAPSRLPSVVGDQDLAELLGDEPGGRIELDDDSPRRIADDAVLELLYGSGLRVSEVCDLHTESADLSLGVCLLYTSPSPRDQRGSRMPSSA